MSSPMKEPTSVILGHKCAIAITYESEKNKHNGTECNYIKNLSLSCDEAEDCKVTKKPICLSRQLLHLAC